MRCFFNSLEWIVGTDMMGLLKKYSMNRRGGYINPPLLMAREINRCKHDATTPSGCARRVQTRYDCSSVSVLVISPPQEGNCLVQA